jgi:nucleoid DNA-binding protein
MTKAELVEKVANQINLTKKQTEVVVNTVFSSITDSLAEGKKQKELCSLDVNFPIHLTLPS